MEFNAETHVGEGGTMTDQFITDFHADLGDDYAGKDYTQLLKEAGGFSGLAKRFVDTKSAYDTKLEGVIQKPGENATDEQKAEYAKLCRTGAGLDAPTDATGYTFARAEGDGITEAEEASYRAFCLEKGVPDAVAGLMWDYRKEAMAAGQVAQAAQIEKDWTESTEDLKKDWSGEELAVNIRLAHQALMQFGSDDMEHDGNTYKGLKTLLKEADLFTNPSNFDKWREVMGDGAMAQLRSYANIGKRMQSGDIKFGSAGGKTKEQLAAEAHDEALRSVNAGSPSLMAQIPK